MEKHWLIASFSFLERSGLPELLFSIETNTNILVDWKPDKVGLRNKKFDIFFAYYKENSYPTR